MTSKAFPKVLGVKMCGNCNPAIRSLETARAISRKLGMELAAYDDPRVQILLVINGCQVGCVQMPNAIPVRIEGLFLNGAFCADQAELVQRAVIEIKKEVEEKAYD